MNFEQAFGSSVKRLALLPVNEKLFWPMANEKADYASCTLHVATTMGFFQVVSILFINLIFCAGNPEFRQQEVQGKEAPVNTLNQDAAAGHQPQDGPNALHGSEPQHNREHVMEHLNGMVDQHGKPLSEEEVQFHYFKLHDYNSDNRLDGVELTAAMTHFHHDDPKGVKVLSDLEIEGMIDGILRDDDRNNDGYIDYAEYMVTQKENAAKLAANPTTL